LKVLILSQRFSTQLAERVQLLEQHGEEVFLLCFELNNRFASRSFIFFSEPNNPVSKILFILSLIKYFKWSDVVHWYGGDIKHYSICLWLQRIFSKKGIIEFKKSDVFIPEIEYNDNVAYRNKWFDNVKKPDGDYQSSLSLQKLFSNNNLIPLTEASLSQYLLPDCFPPPYQFTSTTFLYDEQPKRLCKPIDKTIKIAVDILTDHLTDELEQLLNEIETKYKRSAKITRVTSALIVDVTYAIQHCDIWIGSTVNGHYSYWDWYAFSKGKVVLTYVKPYFTKRYYKSFPLLVTDGSPLNTTITKLLDDNLFLENVQSQNKNYFTENLSKEKTIKGLIEFYKKVAV